MDEEINQYTCPHCGRALIFDSNLSSYFCSECNEYFEQKDYVKKEENEFTGKYTEVDCLSCGKRYITSVNKKSDLCPFCYTNLLDDKDGVFKFKPNFIIPFKEDMQTFKDSFFGYAKQFNVPLELITGLQNDSLKGVYFPIYVYTVENIANGFMQTHDSADYGDDFYRQKLSYIENLDVLIDSTGIISNREMSEFADFDIKKVDMFFPDRLKDNITLYPLIGQDKAWSEMKKVVTSFIEAEVSKYKGKKEVIKELKVFNTVKNLSRRLILMPIWMMETKVNGEIHYIYVNDQTKRIVSDLEFEQVYKKSLFGKKKVENFQVRLLDRDEVKFEEFKTSIEYLNELRKFEVNQNDRLANIRKIR